jgi:hypothetical protein
VTGPLWGLQSKNGYDMPPNTTLTLDQLTTYFTRWHYDPLPMVWDGTFVSIQPLTDEELAAAAATPPPLPVPTPEPTPTPTAAPTPEPTPRPQTDAPSATAPPEAAVGGAAPTSAPSRAADAPGAPTGEGSWLGPVALVFVGTLALVIRGLRSRARSRAGGEPARDERA